MKTFRSGSSAPMVFGASPIGGTHEYDGFHGFPDLLGQYGSYIQERAKIPDLALDGELSGRHHGLFILCRRVKTL